MNPLSVVILIGNIVDVCTVYLTPSDDAYQTLLESIGYDDKMANDFNLNPYETDEQKIENVNNAIYGLSEETIDRFFKKSLGFSKGYGRRVVLVSDSTYIYLPPEFTTKKPTTPFSRSNLDDASKNGKKGAFSKIRRFFRN